jgi:N-methylhydantoinase A
MAYRLGVDIGGTFTDATLINEETGEIHIGKVSSTPQDPSLGFIEVTQRILRQNNVAPAEITYLVHGTTVATNAIIEGKVARTGFITTAGFRDMLEIARQIRPSLYDLGFEKPKPLVPRYLCFGVPERLDGRGQLLTPLDETVTRQIAGQLRREQVEAVAVCLLHAYANPDHEQRVGQIIQEIFPEAVLSLSSEVAPEFREYYRASTTVINASIRPVVARYLQRIEARLRQEGLAAELLLMQSSGGVFSFAEASRKPVFMVESGPAAGVIAAAFLGEALGHKEIISFDMGGTTAKVGLIQNGAPKITKDYEVGAAARAGLGSQRGAGYPLRTPVIDLVEIGAGGGSIAWVDSGGILRVGPHSAGADPGPVCYGKGGTEPTVTDANLVLGRLQPDLFLNGEIELDVAAARRAIQEKCAGPLGMALVEAAHGIVEIANAAMVNALRLVSVQRGYDPRDFVLVAFGGAGPVHANRLAHETEMPHLVVPLSPGTFSALGLLVTDLKHDFSTTMIERLDRLEVSAVEAAFHQLEARGRASLAREAVRPQDTDILRQVDVRYVGQSYELTLPLPNHPLDRSDIDDLGQRFYREHDRAYGFSAPGEPVEVVNLRLTAVGRITKPRLAEWEQARNDFLPAPKAVRSVYFAEHNGYVACPVYDRYQLATGQELPGPAIVVELDATTVIHPGYQARVDKLGNLILAAGLRAQGS